VFGEWLARGLWRLLQQPDTSRDLLHVSSVQPARRDEGPGVFRSSVLRLGEEWEEHQAELSKELGAAVTPAQGLSRWPESFPCLAKGWPLGSHKSWIWRLSRQGAHLLGSVFR
jgi:hypothetical protein